MNRSSTYSKSALTAMFLASLSVLNILMAQETARPEPQQPSGNIEVLKSQALAGDVHADVELGHMYMKGIGVQRDYAQAFVWFEKAAKQEDALGEDNLGDLYRNGRGVSKDYTQALGWYRKAAYQGLPQAENNIGSLYQYGLGLPKDYRQALAWYQKAANQGDAEGEYNVGNFYAFGHGVAKDYAEAFAWFQRAANQGYANAENILGLMYKQGLGVKQDNAQAISWLRKAAAQGNPAAETNLANLNAEIALAQKTPNEKDHASGEQYVMPSRCVAFNKFNSGVTPDQLYGMVVDCVRTDDYPSAVALFVLAGMDARFDISRVTDKDAAGKLSDEYVGLTFGSIVETAAQKKLAIGIQTALNDKSVAEYLCEWVQQVGPPTYNPQYMMMDEVSAGNAETTQKQLHQELLPVSDASGRWKTISASFLHCAPAGASAPRPGEDSADRYRSTINRAIADSTAQTASQKGMPTNSPSSSPNGNATTSDQQGPTYGPLTFNREGADFYVAQDGSFTPASVVDGSIVIHLHPRSFQIGYNGEQMNLCLAQSSFPEIRPDPHGYKASCLSGPFSGAREPDSDVLLVYGGHKWSDGNTEFSDETSMKATPMKGFQFAYRVNQLLFVEARDIALSTFKGTLYGYIVVYKQHERSNKDIMPIQLMFE